MKIDNDTRAKILAELAEGLDEPPPDYAVTIRMFSESAGISIDVARKALNNKVKYEGWNKALWNVPGQGGGKTMYYWP